LLKEQKDKGKKVAKNTEPGAAPAEGADIEEEEETSNLSREERQKKYLERADVQEAVNVAADLAIALEKPDIRLGAQNKGTHAASDTENN